MKCNTSPPQGVDARRQVVAAVYCERHCECADTCHPFSWPRKVVPYTCLVCLSNILSLMPSWKSQMMTYVDRQGASSAFEPLPAHCTRAKSSPAALLSQRVWKLLAASAMPLAPKLCQQSGRLISKIRPGLLFLHCPYTVSDIRYTVNDEQRVASQSTCSNIQ